MRWGPANGRQGKKDEVRMKERKIKERKMPGSALVPNYGTARRDPLQRGSEHWLTVLAWVEMLIGECQSLPGLPLLQVFLHKLRLSEHSGV